MQAKSFNAFENDPSHHFNILVVDDDADFSDLLAHYLQKIPNAVVTLAHTFKDAVSELSHHRFDLIVSDWMLDKGNAPEIFANADAMIPERCEKQPILFMSSSDRLSAIHGLESFAHFEPISFILKRFGPPLISLLAENALCDGEDDGTAKNYGAFQGEPAENSDFSSST